jgi:hypothetical protein
MLQKEFQNDGGPQKEPRREDNNERGLGQDNPICQSFFSDIYHLKYLEEKLQNS